MRQQCYQGWKASRSRQDQNMLGARSRQDRALDSKEKIQNKKSTFYKNFKL